MGTFPLAIVPAIEEQETYHRGRSRHQPSGKRKRLLMVERLSDTSILGKAVPSSEHSGNSNSGLTVLYRTEDRRSGRNNSIC
jgi:hypothetical protein